MKSISSLLSISFLSIAVFSMTPTIAMGLDLSGKFEIKADTYHRASLTGTMNTSFDDKSCSITLVTETVIRDQNTFTSIEQFCVLSSDGKNVALAFKVNGPPHKWFYVEVATLSEDGKIFVGTFYKVPGSIEDIQKLLATGSPSEPTSWKKVGSGTLSSTQP